MTARRHCTTLHPRPPHWPPADSGSPRPQWAGAAPSRSMIERRVWARPTESTTGTPRSSGPWCPNASVARKSWEASGLPHRRMTPAQAIITKAPLDARTGGPSSELRGPQISNSFVRQSGLVSYSKASNLGRAFTEVTHPPCQPG
jgi:hypothetical protein